MLGKLSAVIEDQSLGAGRDQAGLFRQGFVAAFLRRKKRNALGNGDRYPWNNEYVGLTPPRRGFCYVIHCCHEKLFDEAGVKNAAQKCTQRGA